MKYSLQVLGLALLAMSVAAQTCSRTQCNGLAASDNQIAAQIATVIYSDSVQNANLNYLMMAQDETSRRLAEILALLNAPTVADQLVVVPTPKWCFCLAPVTGVAVARGNTLDSPDTYHCVVSSRHGLMFNGTVVPKQTPVHFAASVSVNTSVFASNEVVLRRVGTQVLNQPQSGVGTWSTPFGAFTVTPAVGMSCTAMTTMQGEMSVEFSRRGEVTTTVMQGGRAPGEIYPSILLGGVAPSETDQRFTSNTAIPRPPTTQPNTSAPMPVVGAAKEAAVQGNDHKLA